MTSRSGWTLDWLSLDGKKLLVTRVLGNFGYGYLTVVLALYLEKLGLDPIRIGAGGSWSTPSWPTGST